MRIEPSPRFIKDAKTLAKKYKKLSDDLEFLQKTLLENPLSGTPLGNNIFKIRIPNSSIPTGKSGGFRVITYYLSEEILFLLTIYSKSDRESISSSVIDSIVENL
ncbi:type II toxin-antitoxin system RelE/ParE family toxin [Sulfuricurvum sp.]|uniref:type II toxin-antitoxin system RelE/ParE family toxin n=1 Tax=Sulfuricurvum sp. TaxID=2025608 RepID=UPI00261FD3E7|nr:type II toxin-antitoxin system RelE/ParE family toxin [Sulfuricurvum sp.]MDD2779997.1 type II toxin-antitoxin system RelE/ParE family toxin [Sulfuricurvum sp.]